MLATYNLVMKSEAKSEPTTVELPCSVIPDTVKDLKVEIEEQHNVPIDMQYLKFHGELLTPDDTKLKKVGLNTGDSIEVCMF